MHSKRKTFRLLVVTSTFPRWQEDTQPKFVYDLCYQLGKKGVEVDVLAPNTDKAKSKETMEGISVHRFSYFISKWQKLAYSGGMMENLKKNRMLYLVVPFYILSQLYAIFRLIRKNKYDVIHAHWIIPQGFTCAIVKTILGKNCPPIVCTSHGGDLFSLQSFLLLKMKQWVLIKVEGITVVSGYMLKPISQLVENMDKVSVCPMGVELKELFKPVSNIKRDKHRLIFVGRLVEKKGVIYLLESVKQLLEVNINVNLLIVGDGPEKEKLIKKTEDLGITTNVNFYGAVPQAELPCLYSSATIAVVPSVIGQNKDQEGLGLVLIEAMGCGCAVIASSLGAIRDVIQDGENGILVKTASPDEITSAVLKLIKNEDMRSKLVTNARASVLAKFDWEVASSRYSALFKDLMPTN